MYYIRITIRKFYTRAIINVYEWRWKFKENILYKIQSWSWKFSWKKEKYLKLVIIITLFNGKLWKPYGINIFIFFFLSRNAQWWMIYYVEFLGRVVDWKEYRICYFIIILYNRVRDLNRKPAYAGRYRNYIYLQNLFSWSFNKHPDLAIKKIIDSLLHGV